MAKPRASAALAAGPMETIKHRNVNVKIDGMIHEVTLVFKRDSVAVSPIRRKTGEEEPEEFPARIVGAPEGLNSADFFYAEPDA